MFRRVKQRGRVRRASGGEGAEGTASGCSRCSKYLAAALFCGCIGALAPLGCHPSPPSCCWERPRSVAPSAPGRGPGQTGRGSGRPVEAEAAWRARGPENPAGEEMQQPRTDDRGAGERPKPPPVSRGQSTVGSAPPTGGQGCPPPHSQAQVNTIQTRRRPEHPRGEGEAVPQDAGGLTAKAVLAVAGTGEGGGS